MAVLKEISTVISIKMPIGENWNVNRCRYRSDDGAGKRLCIATGIHGDERMGQLVAYDVARRIAGEPQHFSGTLDIYPMLNPIGMDLDERTVPGATKQDMNRAFPGVADGTALENICHAIMEDLKGADLVLDVHTSSHITSELYGVRLHEQNAQEMIPAVNALCPRVIWVLPDKAVYNATLTGALTQAGTNAAVLMVDERRLRTQKAVDEVVEGIFCKMKEMGMWSGTAKEAPQPGSVLCMWDQTDICRVTCTHPGMYIPAELNGSVVQAGDSLGIVFNALTGEAVETVTAPETGLVFTQRRYSAVYPGSLIARLCRKEHA